MLMHMEFAVPSNIGIESKPKSGRRIGEAVAMGTLAAGLTVGVAGYAAEVGLIFEQNQVHEEIIDAYPNLFDQYGNTGAIYAVHDTDGNLKELRIDPAIFNNQDRSVRKSIMDIYLRDSDRLLEANEFERRQTVVSLPNGLGEMPKASVAGLVGLTGVIFAFAGAAGTTIANRRK